MNIERKIKACFARAKSTTSPNEAAIALKQAQALMAKYNLTDLDIKLSEVGELDIRAKHSYSKARNWECGIFNLVAKAFRCMNVWIPGSKGVLGTYRIIGRSSNLPIVEYTTDVLLRQLVKARHEFKQSLDKELGVEIIKKQVDSFGIGWITMIIKTVNEFAGLPEEVERYLDRYELAEKPTASDMKKGLCMELGFNKGKDAAKGVSLYRPCEGASGKLKIGNVDNDEVMDDLEEVY